MWRRLESLSAALGILAAIGGAYYLKVEGHLPSLFNTWSVLALVAAGFSFYGITVSIHGHGNHTRLSIVLGFLLAAVVALVVYRMYNAAYVPEAALLLLVLLCAELRVFTKEPDRRKPENVGAARNQGTPRRAARQRR
jgi:O-antigen/teichoic acid export membrane protein